MTPDEFKKMRKAAGFTQAQMAERLGVSRRTVISWEAGEYSLPADIADKVAAESLQASPNVKHKEITFKTHPHMYNKHPGGKVIQRNHNHPHWYLRSPSLRARVTEAERLAADNFISTTAHLEGFTPMTSEEAVAFLVERKVPEAVARQECAQFGWVVAGIKPKLTDDELMR